MVPCLRVLADRLERWQSEQSSSRFGKGSRVQITAEVWRPGQCSGARLGAVTQVKAVALKPVGDLVFPEADGRLDSDVGDEPTAYPGVNCLGVHLEAGFEVLRRQ